MDTSRRPRLDTSYRLARTPTRGAAEPTALILIPQARTSPSDEDGPTKVKIKTRLPACPWIMTMDEADSGARRAVPSAPDARAAAEATAVDSHVADRIAAELAIAQREAEAKAPPPREPEPTLRLGKYGLMSYLASGRTSHVYLARLEGPAGFARHLAVKKLRARHARDPRRVARFLEGARLFSTLHHGSIAQISDVGVDGDTPYLAMEHLHGVSLRTALDRCPGGLPLEFAVTAIASCAEALHYARSKQPAHGHRYLGIAPSYAMACLDGSVKLLRLGTTGDSPSLLSSGELAYLSPEHARGEAVDARSDVFALGVMFYELTTGAHPYLDPSSEPTCRAARDRLVHAEIQPPAERFSWFSLELSDVVMTALARDPKLRYGDARVFGRALLEVARRLSLRPGPRAVGHLVSQLLGVPPAEERKPARGLLPVAESPRQPISHSLAWAGIWPEEETPSRSPARGTSPFETLPDAFPMLTVEGGRASEGEGATTRSVGPASRPRRLLRALAIFVMISGTVMLAAGLGVAARAVALPAMITMQPAELRALPDGRVGQAVERPPRLRYLMTQVVGGTWNSAPPASNSEAVACSVPASVATARYFTVSTLPGGSGLA
jgi:serine/threonine protein kinase